MGKHKCDTGNPAHALRAKDAELLTPGRHRGTSAEHTTPGVRWWGGKQAYDGPLCVPSIMFALVSAPQ